MSRSRLTAGALSLPWSLTFLIFWAFPVLYSLVLGFTNYSLISNREWEWVGLDNFRNLLADPVFTGAIKQTLIFVVGTIPLTTALSLLMALLVNRRFKGRGLFRAGYFIPSITSMVVIALIFTNLFQRGGYIFVLAKMLGFTPPEYGFLLSDDTALISIMGMDVWMSVGYYMLIFLAGLKSIPDELYEAAELSGASAWRQFWSITLPLLRPVALYIIVINSIKSFQVFVEILVMTSGKFDTMTMVYFIYEKGLTTGFESGYASAAAYILFCITALFSIVLFGFLRKKQQVW